MSASFILQEFLPDTSICDDIIAFHELSQDKHQGRVGTVAGHVVDKTKKDSVDVLLDGVVCAKYMAHLQEVVNKYIDTYPQCNMYSPWRVTTPPNIQKYLPEGGYFSWHTERVGADPVTSTRHLVFMTYLNDVSEGGETEFALQGLKVKPQKGLTLIWPADWTHTHRGLPSTAETKYIVTGWFNFV